MKSRRDGEKGEVASWLILGAGLAIVAAGLTPILQPIFTSLATGVGGSGGAVVEVAAGADNGSPNDNNPSDNNPSDGETSDGETSDGETSDPNADANAADTEASETDSTEAGGSEADGAQADGTDADETGAGETEPHAITAEEARELNERIDALPEDGFDPQHPGHDALAEAVYETFEDLELAAAILGYAEQGYDIEIAIALATGDWSAVQGGNPENYSDDQLQVVLRALGFDGLDPSSPGVAELLDALGPELTAQLFHEGWEFEVSGPLGGLSTPGQFILPVGGSATLDATLSTSTGDEIVGIDFVRTHDFEIKASVVGTVEGSAGKSTLNKAFKLLNRLDAVPGPLQELLDQNPLLRGVAKGLPFSVAYSEFTGVEIAYEATLTADQVDAGIVPDIFDPSTLEQGNTILLRGGELSGSSFEATYKLASVHYDTEQFSGLGFGVEVLEDGRIAIFTGDIDAVESRIAVGLKGVIQLGSETRHTDLDLTVAELDLSTPEGQAAYEAFVLGGVIPDSDGPGVVTATSVVNDTDGKTSVAVDLGVFSADHTFTTSGYTVETTTYADGSQVEITNAFHTGSDKAHETVIPISPDGTPQIDQIELKIVQNDMSESQLFRASNGFMHDADYPDADAIDGDGFAVQYTFTAADLIELQDMAIGQMRYDYEYDGYDQIQTFDEYLEDFQFSPLGTIANAPSVIEIATVLTNPNATFLVLDEISVAGWQEFDPLPGEYEVYYPE